MRQDLQSIQTRLVSTVPGESLTARCAMVVLALCASARKVPAGADAVFLAQWKRIAQSTLVHALLLEEGSPQEQNALRPAVPVAAASDLPTVLHVLMHMADVAPTVLRELPPAQAAPVVAVTQLSDAEEAQRNAMLQARRDLLSAANDSAAAAAPASASSSAPVQMAQVAPPQSLLDAQDRTFLNVFNGRLLSRVLPRVAQLTHRLTQRQCRILRAAW
jgi:hypothetical protein